MHQVLIVLSLVTTAWGVVQEHEHLRITVERIADYKPDVLLVEKSVARYAQELLLQKGISVVLNVKRTLLNRLARCTQAQVSHKAIFIMLCMLGAFCEDVMKSFCHCCSHIWAMMP